MNRIYSVRRKAFLSSSKFFELDRLHFEFYLLIFHFGESHEVFLPDLCIEGGAMGAEKPAYLGELMILYGFFIETHVRIGEFLGELGASEVIRVFVMGHTDAKKRILAFHDPQLVAIVLECISGSNATVSFFYLPCS